MRPRLPSIAALAAFASLWPAAPVVAATGEPQLPATTFKLKNGLTVMVHEDHTVPIVAVDVWYHVGSADERPGRTGFAHLFEHLMFQGSAHVGDDEHLRHVARAGGSANASTNTDRTNFYETVPSNFLEQVLFLEADRMGWFVDALAQKGLDTQRDVVRNERRQSYEMRPYGMAEFAIRAAIYPPDHPYHWLTIGSHEDLEAASLDDVKDFYRQWYKPNNATLALVGDVTVAQARKLVDKYFGEIPASGVIPIHAGRQRPVALSSDRRMRLDDRVSLERLYLAWPSPAWFAPGDAELDLLATILGGHSGRLYRRLVRDARVAQSVAVHQASSQLGSLFEIVATAQPGHSAAELQKIVDEELGQLVGARPITDEELERARNQFDASFVYGMASVEGRAEQLSQYYAVFGSADGLARDRARYLDATKEKVQQMAGELVAARRVELTVAPPKKAAPAAVAPAPAAKGAK